MAWRERLLLQIGVLIGVDVCMVLSTGISKEEEDVIMDGCSRVKVNYLVLEK